MRVLIADDDATSRLVLKATASKLGHDCLLATDGSSAWSLLSTQAFDVLLTDWMMPGLNGPELCRHVREETFGRYTYIVLITGEERPEQVLEGMGAGADDYLIKPVDPFALKTRLVAAERVTMLHRQVADFRTRLEEANVELLKQSLTDPLTTLGNRRRMEEDLSRTHSRAVRVGRPYGLVLFDIDHFKLYNDYYGHLAGDETLRQVAQCLERMTRSGESVYRFGGEEFLLLLPDCGPDDPTTAAQRICRSVSNMGIVHEARPTQPLLVTVSGGVTCWRPGTRLSASKLLQKADDALFEAKSEGRNRVRAAAIFDDGDREQVRQ